MTTRKKIWIGVAIFVPIVALTIFYLTGEVLFRLERVDKGLARPDFPYSDYTTEELAKLYPQERNNDSVLTVRTPEETHKLFMDYLRKEDFKNASECCFRQGDWLKTEEFLKSIQDKGQLSVMINDLEIIEGNYNDKNSTASYSFVGTYKGMKIGNILSFVKNSEGVWLIEKL